MCKICSNNSHVYTIKIRLEYAHVYDTHHTTLREKSWKKCISWHCKLTSLNSVLKCHYWEIGSTISQLVHMYNMQPTLREVITIKTIHIVVKYLQYLVHTMNG